MSPVRAVYPRVEMRLKFLISLLVVTLSGANGITATMCASYCASSKSPETEAVHHHNNVTPPKIQKSHVHGHGGRCPACPSTSGVSQNSDCGKFVQYQAIKEGSASQDKSNGGALSYVALSTNVAKPSDRPERQLRLDTSGSTHNSSPSAPLRI